MRRFLLAGPCAFTCPDARNPAKPLLCSKRTVRRSKFTGHLEEGIAEEDLSLLASLQGTCVREMPAVK